MVANGALDLADEGNRFPDQAPDALAVRHGLVCAAAMFPVAVCLPFRRSTARAVASANFGAAHRRRLTGLA